MIVTDNSGAVLGEARKGAHKLLVEFAAQMVEAVQEAESLNVPWDTGHMATGTRFVAEDLTAIVHTTTAEPSSRRPSPPPEGYAYFVHEGTAKKAGRPFLRWAFDATVNSFRHA